MIYVILNLLIIVIISFIIYINKGYFKLEDLIITVLLIFITDLFIIFSDYNIQVNDVEVWSGKIIEVNHTEEWDEWIPPRTETYVTSDGKGGTTTETRIIAGYWQHHSASNEIKTTDNGWIYVSNTPDGKRMNDDFVNSNKELAKYFPIGNATASTHIYENKLKASYSSIYKRKRVDFKKYNLPQYPNKLNSKMSIDRIIGDIPNKEENLNLLDKWNTNLNDTNNKNNKNNIKGYKQVNLIFVNLGDVTEDYGFLLQDYWENGKKNDFIICFGAKGNEIKWCNVFSWSEIERLKIDIKDYMLDKKYIDNFDGIMNDVGNLIEQKFQRKAFADFDYIHINVSIFAKIIMFISTIIYFYVFYIKKILK